MFLYLLLGSSKSRAGLRGGKAQATLCPHQGVQTWEQSEDPVSGSVYSSPPPSAPASGEPGPGAISGVLSAAKADGTRDRAGDRPQ